MDTHYLLKINRVLVRCQVNPHGAIDSLLTDGTETYLPPHDEGARRAAFRRHSVWPWPKHYPGRLAAGGSPGGRHLGRLAAGAAKATQRSQIVKAEQAPRRKGALGAETRLTSRGGRTSGFQLHS